MNLDPATAIVGTAVSDEKDFGQGEYDPEDMARKRAYRDLRNARKEVRRELRRQRRSQQHPPTRYLFWGLMFILWAILILLFTQDRITSGNLWNAFITGLGGILTIRSLVYLATPSYRSRAMGSLIPGIILTVIGLGLLFGYSTWLPLTLAVVGVAVIIISWFLQREISKRLATQATLRESEVKYRHIIDSANSVIMEMDAVGNVTFANQFALDLFGFREEEILGHSVVGTIVAPTSSAASELETMVRHIVTTPEAYLHDEKENLRKNGEKVWMAWTYRPILDESGNLKEILCTAIDRTQQKKAEELAARQMKEETAAEERTRLARDLHDAVSQTLFSTSLIAEVLPKVWERNKDEGLKKLEEVRLLTRGALAEMRTLLFELRPAALADADMRDLLRQLAESVTGRTRVPVALEVNGAADMPADVKIAFYRIAQEALNNVVKHSGASQARVKLICQPHLISLRVSDDGRGFDATQIAAGSFGLNNMRERASQVGASLRVQSKVDEGSEVTAIWQDGAGEVPQ